MSPTRKTRARGYTAVEVMMSMAVLAVGAAGVMSMQRAALQGNAEARSLDTASAIAREWTERLRRDSMTWTLPNQSSTAAANWSTNTVTLAQVASTSNIGTFVFPTAVPTSGANATKSDPGYSPAFDVVGRDITLSGSTYPGVVYCAQIRGDWLVADQLLRATVRVFWLRQTYVAPAGNFCVDDDANAGPSSTAAQTIYHFVYTTTAIRKNPGS